MIDDADANDPRLAGARHPMTINLLVEWHDGKPFVEEVLVDEIGVNTYRLLASPGMLAGLAAGDEFETVEVPGGRSPQVLKRGGNVCVQFFAPREAMAECERFLLDRLQPLGGYLDGRQPTLLVWTIPAAAGFPAFEAPFYEIQKRVPASQWMYGNVYDPADGRTPLNWWT